MGAAAEDEVLDFPQPGSKTEKARVAAIEAMPIAARIVLGYADALCGLIDLSPNKLDAR
jgi:hypothetical protein